MRTKVLLLLALLCTIAQGAWAAAWSVEMTEKYQVVLNGSGVISITAPVYDESGTDHWVSDGRLKVTWADGSGAQQTMTVLQWGFSGSHASDESTLPVNFSTEVGGSIDIKQGNSTSHFSLTSSDGTVSKDVYENGDEETFEFVGNWTLPGDMLSKDLTFEWDVRLMSSTASEYKLTGLSSTVLNVSSGQDDAWDEVYRLTQTTQADWTALTSSTTGKTLGVAGGTAYYHTTDNLTFTNNEGGGSGLKIQGTVYLYLPEVVTITCTGANASGLVGAGAGIELSEGNSLYLLGGGTINATGGNAANGNPGGRGGNASFLEDE